MNEQHTVPQAGRRLIGLYPARYRELYGEDIAATFAEATEGLAGRALLRERLDLASHALRLRLGIASTDPAGRILAGAAPIALALLAGFCLWILLPEVRPLMHRVRDPAASHGRGYAVESVLWFLATFLPWVLALAGFAVGRVRLARVLGLAGTLVWAVCSVVFDPWIQILYGGASLWVALCAVVLLAPPDLLVGSASRRWEATGVAVTFAALMILAHRTELYMYLASFDVYVFWPLLSAAAVLLGRLVVRHPDRYGAAGAGLLGLVWLHPAMSGDVLRLSRLVELLMSYLVLLGLMVALAAGVRMARRARRAGPADPA
ncbi:hypothetical protein [Kitasatospora sp. NPDC094015]|uniref:hypothetical protein n=1 Tax=Kitasatospora sp. NPDC094015 TaxID=3155205 RepID=UPI00332AA756